MPVDVRHTHTCCKTNGWLKLIEDEKIYKFFNKTPMMCTCINRLTYTQHEISIK